jgi:hypothetical protein
MNAVAELADPTHAAHKIAIARKEKRRTLFRKLLKQLDVPDPDGLATQFIILGKGAVAQALWVKRRRRSVSTPRLLLLRKRTLIAAVTMSA